MIPVTLPETYPTGRLFVRGSARAVADGDTWAVALILSDGSTHRVHDGLASEKRAQFIARDYNRMGAPTRADVRYERVESATRYRLVVEYGDGEHAYDRKTESYPIVGAEAYAILSGCDHGEYGNPCVSTEDSHAADWLREHPESYPTLPEDDRYLVGELLTACPSQCDRLYA